METLKSMPTVDPENPLAPAPAPDDDDDGGDVDLTDRLLIDWHSLSLPSLFGLLKCAQRMNGANSGQRSKWEKCEQTEATEESEDRYFTSKVKLSF